MCVCVRACVREGMREIKIVKDRMRERERERLRKCEMIIMLI